MKRHCFKCINFCAVNEDGQVITNSEDERIWKKKLSRPILNYDPDSRAVTE